MNNFNYNTQQAKIQGLSIQVGELFAELYHNSYTPQSEINNALEAYKSLRRLLPRADSMQESRHLGHKAAHKATQVSRRNMTMTGA